MIFGSVKRRRSGRERRPRAGKEGQADVFQYFLAAWPGLGQTMHDIDILMAGHDGSPGCIGGRAAWRLMA